MMPFLVYRKGKTPTLITQADRRTLARCASGAIGFRIPPSEPWVSLDVRQMIAARLLQERS